MSFFAQFVPRASARASIVPALLVVLCVLTFYSLYIFVAPGILTYAFSTFALFVIGITALARLNDIPLERNTVRWHLRRLGLMFVCAASLWLILSPLTGTAEMPSWREVMFRIGVALVWLTTPKMPPWWMYISGHGPAEKKP